MRWFAALTLAACTHAQTAPSPNITTISFPAVSLPILYGLGTGARGVGSTYPVKSSDNGRSWIPLYPFAAGTIQNVTAIAVDPANPQTVYVGAQFNRGGIWKSIDGGLTWIQRSVGLPTNAEAVESLTVAANDTQVLYLMSAGALYKSSDGAATWVIHASIPRGRIALLPVTPVDGYLIARGGATYRAADDGRVWNPRGRIALANGQADPNTISACLTINTANPNIVFSCVHVDATSGLVGMPGFYRSADGGSTWTNVHPTSSSASTHILVDPRGSLVHLNMLFQEGYGRSTDGGVTFTRRASVRPIAMDPRNPDVIYSEGAASVSQDAGLTFTSLNATFRPTFRQPASITTAEVESGQSSTVSIPFTAEDIPFVVTGSATGAPWMTVINRTTTATEIQVQLSAAGLSAGTYEGTLNLTSTQSGTPSATFPVRLVVTPRLLDGPTYAATVVAGGGGVSATQWPADVPAVGANLLSLSKVSIDTKGQMFIAGNGRVRRLAADGTLVAVAGNGLSSPTADGGQATETAFPLSFTSLAVDAQDRFYFTSGSSIRVIENGIVRTEFKLGDPIDGDPDLFPTFFPRGLDFAPNGDLYVAASQRIIRVSAGQRRLTVHLPGATGAFFEDVAVGPDGALYFCDSMKHIVYRLRNGTLTVIAGTEGVSGFNGDGPGTQVRINRPTAIDVDAEGNVWFADTSNNRIRVITPDGNVRTVAGGGNISTTFTGSVGATDLSLSLPSDVTVDAQGNVYFTSSSRLYRLTKDATPRPRTIQGSFVNAGSNVAKLSPGVLFSFYGANMAASTAVASGSPWPTVLGGASVRINGTLVPLFFASPTQINGQVPYEMAIGSTGRAAVTVNGLASSEITFTASASSPGILVFGDNRAVVVNPDGSVNTSTTPAKPQEVLVAYFTGTGILDNAVATGVSAPIDPLSRPALPYKIFVGQAEAPVFFLGLTPGYIGLGQANFEVPDLPPGDYPLTIRIGNEVSNGPVITIGPK